MLEWGDGGRDGAETLRRGPSDQAAIRTYEATGPDVGKSDGSRGLPSATDLNAPAIVFDGFLDGIVCVGETHELKPDGVDERNPACLDDVH